MELKPGYKQTEVGIIPEDWEVQEVREFARVITGPFGTLLKASEYSESDGVPLISVGEIGDGYFRIGQHTPRIPSKVVNRLPQYLLRAGDVVFGRKGAVDRSALVSDREHGWFLGSDGISIRPTSNCHSPYLAAQFRGASAKAWLVQNATGTTMASLNQRVLGRAKIPFASLPEQSAIATALSDVDALLSGLDKLIAKKRDLKQAAMQQLLTGKTRLPGFGGEWVTQKLGDAATLKARIGWQGLTTAEYLDTGNYYLVTGTDFANGRIDWDHCHYVMQSRYNQDPYIQVRPRDVLVTKDGTIGKVALVDRLDRPATLNSGVFVIRPKNDSFEPEFFYFLLMSKVFDEFLSQLSAGSTINHLYQKDFVGFTYQLPSTKEEQAAIAEVLSDMDVELATLEARREKTRLLKQGMMQELLTGKTRLV